MCAHCLQLDIVPTKIPSALNQRCMHTVWAGEGGCQTQVDIHGGAAAAATSLQETAAAMVCKGCTHACVHDKH
jgi:hypothetical protein